MKRLIIILLLMNSVIVFAQRQKHFGLQGAANYSGNLLDWSAHDITSLPGISLGAEYYVARENDKFVYLIEGRIDYFRYKRDFGLITDEYMEIDMQYSNLDISIPLLARFFLFGGRSLYLEAGPFVSVRAYSRKTGLRQDDYLDSNVKTTKYSIDESALGDDRIIGLGIAIGIGFQHSLSDDLDIVFNLRNNAALFTTSSMYLSFGIRKALRIKEKGE